MGLFDKDSLWRHKNLGFLVLLKPLPAPDTFRLAWGEPNEDRLSDAMIHGLWTTEEIVKNFRPVPRCNTFWDTVIEGDLLSEET